MLVLLTLTDIQFISRPLFIVQGVYVEHIQHSSYYMNELSAFFFIFLFVLFLCSLTDVMIMAFYKGRDT